MNALMTFRNLLAVCFASLICLPALQSQSCHCASLFEEVKGYFENNNPAFQKIKADPEALEAYMSAVNELTTEIATETSEDRCNVYFSRYINLLHDHHSSVDVLPSRLNLNLNDPAVLDSFRHTESYKGFRKLPIDSTKLERQLQNKSRDAIEGIYTNGRSLLVGLIREKKGHYAAVVMTPGKLLDAGHVLFDLEANGQEDEYTCVYHFGLLGFNFQDLYIEHVRFDRGQFKKIGYFKRDLPDETQRPPFAMTALDDKTWYLRLSSFDYELKTALDSFYASIDSSLMQKPNLIIDLRDNGGGAEVCYYPLLDYLYTKPLVIDEVQVWVTPDNIAHYEARENKDENLIERMHQAPPFTFIPQKTDALKSLTMEGKPYPKHIAILYNSATASSAENMILYAMQSDKVVTLGENSGGFIGYGDVMTKVLSCGKYAINCTTTRYQSNAQYEFVGIPPMVDLQKEKKDWISVAKAYLDKEK